MKFSYPRFSVRPIAAAGVLSALLVVSTGALLAGPVPGNLGSGLDVLVRERLAVQAAANPDAEAAKAVDTALVAQAEAVRGLAFTTEQDQVKVYIHLVKPLTKRKRAALLPASAVVTAMDLTYRGGVIEAFVGLNDVATLARTPGVSSVILAVRPILDVGVTTAQGVVQHRVNTITQTGAGITVGVMSDSFGNSGNVITPATDVSTGDLPGPGNPNGNTQPVVILDDPITVMATDEGRGMAQIIHDMAPGARLGFATASTGQVSFADNIRSLAGLPSGTKRVAGFAANVIVDDLFYSDSPMFGTSLVGRAVNEVAGVGITYFSSAGNRPSQQGYFSDARIVTPAAGQAANPTLVFTNVPAALYAGGFHNFRTDGTTDIAQTITGGGGISFQWDDPYDVTPPSFNPTPFFSSTGTLNASVTQQDFIIPFTAAQQYRVNVVGTAASPNFDAVVTIIDPNGTQVLQQDTGFPEEVFFFPSVSGNHTVRVTGFDDPSPTVPPSTGTFTIEANTADGTPRVTTDYNLLFFSNTTGAFITAIASNNLASNQPLELSTMPAGTVQLVIARANTPTAPMLPRKVRYVMTTTGRPLEYFDYQAPITFGHNHEPGALSTAGHGPFAPFLPEDYSSPGPTYIYFDADANRLAQPIIRQKPDVAAATNVNTTFFGGDSTRDADAFPNFGGTSAAAPTAAGIAALVLQSRGGPGSVTQPQMRSILQSTAFPHDLDPFFASGAAKTSPSGGKVTITVRSNANGFAFGDAASRSTTDPDVVAVSYVGPSSVATLSFDMRGGSTASGNEVTGLATPGLVWDTRTTAAGGFPFTVGRTTGGLTAAGAITPTFTNQAPAPSVTGQFFTLDIAFAAGTFTGGSGFTFGCDRDEFSGANNPPASAFGNNADQWGINYSIPAGVLVTPLDQSGVPAAGVRFSGTLADGSTFSGVIRNKNGKGYSPLDGFGFINAEAAVTP